MSYTAVHSTQYVLWKTHCGTLYNVIGLLYSDLVGGLALIGNVVGYINEVKAYFHYGCALRCAALRTWYRDADSVSISLPTQRRFQMFLEGLECCCRDDVFRQRIIDPLSLSIFCCRLKSHLFSINFLSRFLTLLSNFVRCPRSDSSFWTLQSLLHLAFNTHKIQQQYDVKYIHDALIQCCYLSVLRSRWMRPRL